MRVIGGRSRGRRLAAKLPDVGAADLGPGARVDLRHPGLTGRRRGPPRGRPVLRQRRARGRGALPGGGLGHLRRPRPRRAGRRPPEPRRGGPRRRAGRRWCGPRCPAGSSPRPPGAFDLALCDPPYDFEDWPALLGALRADTVVMESASPDRAARRPGWSRESAGTAVRSSPWLIAAVTAREGRALPGLLRPLPQRASRDRRAGQPSSSTRSWWPPLRNPQKSTALFDLEERQEMLEEVVAHLPSRADRLGVDPAGQRGPRRRRLGDRPRPAGRLGLRGRDADGPDEQPPLRRRDDLHPDQPRVVLRRLQARARGVALRR